LPRFPSQTSSPIALQSLSNPSLANTIIASVYAPGSDSQRKENDWQKRKENAAGRAPIGPKGFALLFAEKASFALHALKRFTCFLNIRTDVKRHE
jgi:hypothetical protein